MPVSAARGPRFRSILPAIALWCALGAVAMVQGPVRRLTTVDALRQYPRYFHLQPVVVRGRIAVEAGRTMLRTDDSEVRLILGDASGGGGDDQVEVRGQLIDVGRLEPGDPRLAGYQAGDPDRWPRPGEELIIRATAVDRVQPQTTPTLRALALDPARFVDQQVKVIGQFRGRNLFGDLPDAPKKSRFDFVIKVADAAVWVTGLRPRGRGFELDVDARVDTSRWVEVTGTLAREAGLVTIAATRIALAEPPEETPEPEPPPALPPPPPVEVVFSSPTEGETDIGLDARVRIQFSRSIDPESLRGRIRASYLGAESMERGEAQPPDIEYTTSYDPGTRALEITFARPLERFRTLRLQLLEGITGFDGAPVVPWTLTFSLGG